VRLSNPIRIAVLVSVLFAASPVVWLLGGCLAGTTAGAGMATLVTPEEALLTDDPTLSIKDDKFSGLKITRLQQNLVPDPEGSVLSKVYFDGVCINHLCHAVLHLSGVASLTEDYERLDLVVDGSVFKGMRGRPVVTVQGYAIEGSLVVRLDVEAMRAIIAAREIEFRIEPNRADDGGVDLDGDDLSYEGKLSPENVVNFRELLSLSGVDPWAAEAEEDKVKAPRRAPTVGRPPPSR
jgi:hypothetical protein